MAPDQFPKLEPVGERTDQLAGQRLAPGRAQLRLIIQPGEQVVKRFEKPCVTKRVEASAITGGGDQRVGCGQAFHRQATAS
ncbi:hypothetical protein ACFB49_08240 [Sphingomonas sp. DBB INV C78]